MIGRNGEGLDVGEGTGIEAAETVIRIYYTRKDIFNKRGKNT